MIEPDLSLRILDSNRQEVIDYPEDGMREDVQVARRCTWQDVGCDEEWLTSWNGRELEKRRKEKGKGWGGKEAIICCRLEGWLLGRALCFVTVSVLVVIYFWLDGASTVNNIIPLRARSPSGSGLVAPPLRCQLDT